MQSVTSPAVLGRVGGRHGPAANRCTLANQSSHAQPDVRDGGDAHGGRHARGVQGARRDVRSRRILPALALGLQLVAAAVAVPNVARAQDYAALQAEVEALRAEQTRLAAAQLANEAALSRLEAAMESARTGSASSAATAAAAAPAAASPVTPARSSADMPAARPAGAGPATAPATAAAPANATAVAIPANAAATAAPVAAAAALPVSSTAASRWSSSGDLRLRVQGDHSDPRARGRDSAQLRGRFGATFSATPNLTLGLRLATGDPDDPNSTDVQLSNWVDDLNVSLDLAYLQWRHDALTVYGGKFPQPFTRTDLVWDGDVNPQGLGATWRRPLGGGSTLRVNGALLLLDEQAAGAESTMAGAQLGFDSPAGRPWRMDLSAGWFDYDLGSIAGADAGDFRSNLLAPNGRYVSEYELLDVIAGLSWQGRDPAWPLRLTLEHVRNRGAAAGRDTAMSAELTAGRAAQAGDWRLTYGRSMAEVDAVLAAFSHDNIGFGTNYTMHALTVDYTPASRLLVGGIWYHYRPKDAAYAGSADPANWLDRFRLYFQVSF